jgi:hypothetical protein
VTATERFKKLYADAIERVCVLEEQLESARERIVELENANREDEREPVPEA